MLRDRLEPWLLGCTLILLLDVLFLLFVYNR
jgi:hypothetical protein